MLRWLLLVVLCVYTQIFAADRLKIVTTLTLFHEWTFDIVEDRADVIPLLTPDVDGHNLELTPKQLQCLATANLIVENGLGLERGFDRFCTTARTRAVRVKLAELPNIQTIKINGVDDPHVWLDLLCAVEMIQKLGDVLAQRDPNNAAFYQKNVEKMTQKMKHLHAWMLERLVHARCRSLITYHDCWRYFARRYRFEIIGSFVGVHAHDDPSARHMAFLLDNIQRDHIKVIFSENTAQKIIENTAKRIGIGTAIMYTLVDPKDPQRSSYEQMMRHNVNVLIGDLH